MTTPSATLTRVHTEEGWQFTARPHPDGTVWMLRGIRPQGAQVTSEATVYTLRKGDTLVDYFDGRVTLQFRNGDSIEISADGSGLYRRSNQSVRAQLQADGIELEFWVDGPRRMHQHWATVIVYEG